MLSQGDKAKIMAIVSLRNCILHPIGKPPSIEGPQWFAATSVAIDALHHLLLAHPAFDPDPFSVELATVSERIRHLRDRFAPPS